MKTIMAKATALLPVYWKLATLRCGIYALMVGWGSFQVGTEGFDSISAMTDMQQMKLAGNTVVAMFGVWLAFLDQTMTKIAPSESRTDTISVTQTKTVSPEVSAPIDQQKPS